MPPLLGATGKSEATNPVLDIFTPDKGKLKDPVVLEFQIFAAESDVEQLIPVQKFPSTPGTRQSVDVVTLIPTGEKIALGHFVAKFDPTADSVTDPGRYLIRWFFKFDATEPERVVEYEFEIMASSNLAIRDFSYALLRDLREEGVTAAVVNDSKVLRSLKKAREQIENATGRFFFPRLSKIEADGTNSREYLRVADVIIALQEVEIVNQTLLGASSGLIDLEDIFVYSRHLSQRLNDPDDREDPKLSFIKRTDLGGLRDPADADLLFRDRLIFPGGSQNVMLTALWGYTEPDPHHKDDQIGRVPLLIREVCIKLAILNNTPLNSGGGTGSGGARGPIKSEKTRSQSVTYGAKSDSAIAARAAGLFGDEGIDIVLAQFRRPVDIGAA